MLKKNEKKERQSVEQIKLIGVCCSSLPDNTFLQYMCLSQSVLSISLEVNYCQLPGSLLWMRPKKLVFSRCCEEDTIIQTSNPRTLQGRMLSNDHFWLHFYNLSSRWCWPLRPFCLPFWPACPLTFALPTNVSATIMKPRVLLPWSHKLLGTLPRNILSLKIL